MKTKLMEALTLSTGRAYRDFVTPKLGISESNDVYAADLRRLLTAAGLKADGKLPGLIEHFIRGYYYFIILFFILFIFLFVVYPVSGQDSCARMGKRPILRSVLYCNIWDMTVFIIYCLRTVVVSCPWT